MTYEKFKEIIESFKQIGEKEYNQLVKQYSKKTVDSFLEKYIEDNEVSEEDKFSRTVFYVEKLYEEENIFETNSENINSKEEYIDIFNAKGKDVRTTTLFLMEMGKIPLLTIEEEQNLGKILLDLRQKKEQLQITDESLDQQLISIGFKNIKDRRYDSRRQQSRFLGKKVEKLENKIKELDSIKSNDKEINELIKISKQKLNEIKELKVKLDIQKEYQKAFEEFTERNLRLVVSIAKRYNNGALAFEDLIQEGSNGLMKAIEKFDIDKGYKFSTYGTWWIRQSVTRAIADQCKTVRIPVHMTEQINKVIRANRTLTTQLERTPTDQELSDYTGFPVEKIREINIVNQDIISLSTPIGEEDGDSFLGDFIPDLGTDIESETTNGLLRESLEEVLKNLSPKEEKVLRLRYGLDDGITRTLGEVGEIFHVTRERIRQIESKALRRLRTPNNSKKIKDFL